MRGEWREGVRQGMKDKAVSEDVLEGVLRGNVLRIERVCWSIERICGGVRVCCHLAIAYGLPNHPPHELEIVQMVGIDDAQRIGLKGRAVCNGGGGGGLICCEEKGSRKRGRSQEMGGYKKRAVVDSPTCGWGEQGVVGVEYLPGQDHVPLAGEPSGINAFFPLEVHLQTTAKLLRGAHPQLMERVLEHLAAVNVVSEWCRERLGWCQGGVGRG